MQPHALNPRKTPTALSSFYYCLIAFKVAFFLYLFARGYSAIDPKVRSLALLPVAFLCVGAMICVASGLTWRQASTPQNLRRVALILLVLSLTATGIVMLLA
jgi:hypothetical protein